MVAEKVVDAHVSRPFRKTSPVAQHVEHHVRRAERSRRRPARPPLELECSRGPPAERTGEMTCWTLERSARRHVGLGWPGWLFACATTKCWTLELTRADMLAMCCNHMMDMLASWANTCWLDRNGRRLPARPLLEVARQGEACPPVRLLRPLPAVGSSQRAEQVLEARGLGLAPRLRLPAEAELVEAAPGIRLGDTIACGNVATQHGQNMLQRVANESKTPLHVESATLDQRAST